MSKRRRFEVPGIEHENPIPAATRIGSLVMSSGIFPRDPATGKAPDSLEEQCAVMFADDLASGRSRYDADAECHRSIF